MFKNKIWNKILAVVLVLSMIPISNMNVFGAGAGSGGRHTPSGSVPSNKSQTQGGVPGGTKISLLIFERGKYDEGIVMKGTPLSPGIGNCSPSPTSNGGVGSYISLYPIYVIPENRDELYYTDTGMGSIKSSPIYDYSVDVENHKGGASFHGLTELEDIQNFSKFRSAFIHDWFGDISPNVIEASLGLDIKFKELSKDDERLKKAESMLKTIGKVMKSIYETAPEIDDMIKNPGKYDYCIMVEPLVSVRGANGQHYYVTIRNFEQICLQGAVRTTDRDSREIRDAIGGPESSVGVWSEIIGAMIGKYRLGSTLYADTTIGGKIFYSGPKSDGGDYAEWGDEKYGMGVWSPTSDILKDGAEVIQIQISDSLLNTKESEPFRVVMRPEGEGIIKDSLDKVTTETNLKNIELEHSKESATSYYGASSLLASDYSIEEKKLANLNLTSANVEQAKTLEDKTHWLMLNSMYPSILESTKSGTLTSLMKYGMAQRIIASPTDIVPTKKILDGSLAEGTVIDRVTHIPYVNAPLDDNMVLILKKNKAAATVNKSTAEWHDKKDVKTIYSEAFYMDFGEDEDSASRIANGSQFLWFKTVNDVIDKALKDTTAGQDIKLGGHTVVSAKGQSDYIYGMRTNDTSTSFSKRAVDSDNMLKFLQDMIKPNSLVASMYAENYNFTIKDTDILDKNITIKSDKDEQEQKDLMRAISVLGEDVKAADARAVRQYSKSGVGSKPTTELTNLDDGNGGKLDYRDYYGKLMLVYNYYEKYTPIDLCIVKDGKLVKVYSDAWYGDLYNGITIPTDEQTLGIKVKNLAVMPSKVNLDDFIKEFVVQSSVGGSLITVDGVSVPLVQPDGKDVTFGVAEDDITNSDRLAVFIEIEPVEPKLSVITVKDTKEDGVVIKTETTLKKIVPIPETYNIKDDGNYELVEWFTVLDKEPYPVTPTTPWSEVIGEEPKDEQGTTPEEVEIKVPDDATDEVIYIHYEKDTTTTDVDGKELILTEKRISRRFTTENIVPGRIKPDDKDSASSDAIDEGMSSKSNLISSDAGQESDYPGGHCPCTGSASCSCPPDADGDPCECACGFDEWVDGSYKVVYVNRSGVTDSQVVAKASNNINGTAPFLNGKNNGLSTTSANFGLVHEQFYGSDNESGKSSRLNYYEKTNRDETGENQSLNPYATFVAYRGYGLPTISKYSYDIDKRVVLGTHESVLAELDITKNNKPVALDKSGPYKMPLIFNFGNDGSLGGHTADLSLSSICNAEQAHSHSVYDLVLNYRAYLTVEKYVDKENKGLDKSVVLGNTSTKINDKTINHLVEGVVNATDAENLTYHTYIEMVYDSLQKIAEEDDMRVNVLSDSVSTYKPNDYVEYGWYNAKDVSKDSMIISSTQWTTHTRGTTGVGWRQKDRVLPGGAIFTISHNNPTTVGIATWQTFAEDTLITAVGSSAPYENFAKYKLTDKTKHHTDLVANLKKQLEVTHVQMWGNTNNGAEPYAGQRVGSGTTFNSKKLGVNSKYWFSKDASGNSAKSDEGDLDVIPGTEKTKKTYYRMRADVDGKVYVERFISADGSAVPTNSNGLWTGATAIKIWNKDDTIGTLSGELKDLNDRTKLVTNFFKSIERNVGNDATIKDMSDKPEAKPTWYNEAFRGICVVRTETVFDIGFHTTKLRSSVLDPYLEPAHSDKASILTNAFVLGIKIEEKNIMVDFGTLATKSKTKVKDEQEMLVAKKFWVPNFSVTDNVN